ncbi:MAG: hypothetical protein C4297_04645 [Gemmataceae bacterium]
MSKQNSKGAYLRYVTCKLLALAALTAMQAQVVAGLHIPLEPPIVPAANASDFLGQLARLRAYGPPDRITVLVETAQRKDYLQKVAELKRRGRLSAKEAASLGGYLIRLRVAQSGYSDYQEAIEVLEQARREHGRHYTILANLGTAYQLAGLLDSAARALEEATALAPPDARGMEHWHLRLVRLRQHERIRPGLAPLDSLFPVRFTTATGSWIPGQLAPEDRDRLAPDALAIVQQLLLWLPDDGRLHWLYGELANAAGDLRGALEAMNLAVDLFRLSTPELKARRLLLREAIVWRELAQNLGSPSAVQQWLASAISAGGQMLAAPETFAWAGLYGLVQSDRAGRRPDWAADLPLASEVPGSETSAGSDLRLGLRGWTVIVLGSALMLALSILQARQWLRRLLQGRS